jgi:glycosyltransferase involved in cell wall biosynthesis
LPRVSLVADSDGWGGAEVYLTHLARRAEENGWSASAVVAEPVAAQLGRAVNGVQVSVVPLTRHAERAPELRRVLAGQRPDAVLVNLVDPGSNRAAVEAAVSVAPTVGVLHLGGDLGPDPDGLRQTYGRLAGALSPSLAGGDQLTSELGMSRRLVAVVPNGVDVSSSAAALPSRPVPLLGTVGRLTTQKGFDLLIQAVRRLVADGTRLDVAIAGSGREEAALHAAATDLPVRFCGHLADVRPFLRELDLFCLPSRHEALPLALLEAMAEARPCVATDVGDVAAAVAGTVVVVPPGDVDALADALAALLRDADARADLGARAYRRVRAQLDAATMARRTFRFLERAAASPASASAPGPRYG